MSKFQFIFVSIILTMTSCGSSSEYTYHDESFDNKDIKHVPDGYHLERFNTHDYCVTNGHHIVGGKRWIQKGKVVYKDD